MDERKRRPAAAVVALGLSILAAGLLLGGIARSARADAPVDVDVALVLAVDVSGSISDVSWRLQRDGIADAVGSPAFAQSVGAGIHGRIAILVMQWGTGAQAIGGWRTLQGGGDARALAAEIRAMDRTESGATCMANALRLAAAALAPWEEVATRRVIDVSGDGADNCSVDLGQVRAQALAAGLTINGLPIVTETEPTIDAWYERQVIGGPGAFLVRADGYPAFAEAFLKKLTNEIAAIPAR